MQTLCIYVIVSATPIIIGVFDFKFSKKILRRQKKSNTMEGEGRNLDREPNGDVGEE